MLRVATALLDSGHEVDFVTARAEQAPNNLPDPRMRYSTLGKHHTRSAIRGLARHLRDRRPDVLLTAMDHANVAGVIAARLSGTHVPVVVSFHSDVSAASRMSGGLFAYVRPTLARWTINRADHVIAISEGVKDGLEEIAPKSRTPISRIYNPTVHDPIFTLAAEPVVVKGDFDLGTTILAVGRLAPEKGFDLLLRSFARVTATHPEMHLLILGEGPLRSDLEARARDLGVADRFHLPGYVANPYQYMARCRIFAFSSLWEGLGNVLVEAGVLGCTIVATDCPSGPRELLDGKSQATLVPVDDVDALTAALLQALDTPHHVSAADWTEHTMAESGHLYEEVLLDVLAAAATENGAVKTAPWARRAPGRT